MGAGLHTDIHGTTLIDPGSTVLYLHHWELVTTFITVARQRGLRVAYQLLNASASSPSPLANEKCGGVSEDPLSISPPNSVFCDAMLVA